MIISVINGPNLNLLGKREKNIYGEKTLDKINESLTKIAEEKDTQIKFFQSNSEGGIVDRIQKDGFQCDGIILNAAAYTHTSVAIRDAILAVNAKVIEVHLSNIYARESFRHNSFISDVCCGVISGFGDYSYTLALNAIIHKLGDENE